MSEQDLAEAPDGLEASHEDEPDVTQKARDMGWTDKADFKGDPDRWIDADTFVKRGEEFVPFLKANNKQLERKTKDLERTVAKLVKESAEIGSRAYDKALRDLKAEHAAAVSAGDVATADDIVDQITDLKAKPPGTPADDFAGKFADWKAENPWYDSDPDLQAFAFGIGEKLGAEKVPPEQQLAIVTQRVKAAFPHKFDNPRRREPGAVEGATNARRPGGKSYSDLPADAKSACDEFVAKGIMNREKYAKEYFA